MSSFGVAPLFCHLLEHFGRFVPQDSPCFRHGTDQPFEDRASSYRHVNAVIADTGLDVPMADFLLAYIITNTVLAFWSPCNDTKNMPLHAGRNRRTGVQNQQNLCINRLLQTPLLCLSCRKDRKVEQNTFSRCLDVKNGKFFVKSAIKINFFSKNPIFLGKTP